MQLSEFQRNKSFHTEAMKLQESEIWKVILSVLEDEHPARFLLSPSATPDQSAAKAWMSDGYERAVRVLKSLTEVPKKELHEIKSTYGAKK